MSTTLHRSKKGLGLFLLAFLSFFVFFRPGSAWAADSDASKGRGLTASLLQELSKDEALQKLGKIDESFSGRGEKVVFFVQDAHTSLAAQKNIAKIISRLVENYDFRDCFEEGFEGPVPSDEYFNIQDPALKERVSYFFLDYLRIGGAEYAHINRKKNFNLIGADDLEAYRADVEQYEKASQSQEEVSRDIQRIEEKLVSLESSLFPKEFQRWWQLSKRYQDKKIELYDFLRRTIAVYLTQAGESQFIGSYPSLSLLVEFSKSEKLDANQTKSLQDEVQKIDAKTLFHELSSLEADLAKRFLKSEDSQKLLFYLNAIESVKKLIHLQISKTELELLKSQLPELATKKILDFIARHSKKTIVLSSLWETAIQDYIRFYELALKREEVVGRTLDGSWNKAILVFGGFHQEGILRMLKEKNISYVLMSPKMDGRDLIHEKRYERLMAGGRNSFEEPIAELEAARPPSLYTQDPADAELLISGAAEEIEKAIRLGTVPEGEVLAGQVEKTVAKSLGGEERRTRLLKRIIGDVPRLEDLKDDVIRGKRVFVRVDFNVPLNADGTISDDERIRAALPTIQYLLERDAKVVLMSHLGRPDGKYSEELSLKPVQKRLEELLAAQGYQKAVEFFPGSAIGPERDRVILNLEPGQILLLDNLRFHPGEEGIGEEIKPGTPPQEVQKIEQENRDFVNALYNTAEVYVNDAFGTAHRAHASTAFAPKDIPQASGRLIIKELSEIKGIIENPKRPFAVILGGAKVSDKIDIIGNLLSKMKEGDSLLIGGAMALTFLEYQHPGSIQDPLVEKDKLEQAGKILRMAAVKGVKIILPRDQRMTTDAIMKGDKQARKAAKLELSPQSEDKTYPLIKAGMRGVDIGPETVKDFSEAIEKAQSVFWNGPVGAGDLIQEADGTELIMKAIVAAKARGAVTVVGGGDSIKMVSKAGLEKEFSYVSTGGGASLELLGGKTLPGIASLVEKAAYDKYLAYERARLKKKGRPFGDATIVERMKWLEEFYESDKAYGLRVYPSVWTRLYVDLVLPLYPVKQPGGFQKKEFETALRKLINFKDNNNWFLLSFSDKVAVLKTLAKQTGLNNVHILDFPAHLVEEEEGQVTGQSLGALTDFRIETIGMNHLEMKGFNNLRGVQGIASGNAGDDWGYVVVGKNPQTGESVAAASVALSERSDITIDGKDYRNYFIDYIHSNYPGAGRELLRYVIERHMSDKRVITGSPNNESQPLFELAGMSPSEEAGKWVLMPAHQDDLLVDQALRKFEGRVLIGPSAETIDRLRREGKLPPEPQAVTAAGASLGATPEKNEVFRDILNLNGKLPVAIDAQSWVKFSEPQKDEIVKAAGSGIAVFYFYNREKVTAEDFTDLRAIPNAKLLTGDLLRADRHLAGQKTVIQMFSEGFEPTLAEKSAVKDHMKLFKQIPILKPGEEAPAGLLVAALLTAQYGDKYRVFEERNGVYILIDKALLGIIQDYLAHQLVSKAA